MSVQIDGHKITMTRGDSLLVTVEIKWPDGESYTPEEGDSIRFALKHSEMNAKRTEFVEEEPLIVKSIPTDSLLLTLNPEDTKSLGFGRNYVYDIELTHSDGRVDTFIADAPFVLAREVH